MNDTIGKKIAKLRKKSKLTQEDLAQKLFVTDGTISKWETDKSVPDYETLKVLAKIFDVKINYFLEDTSIKGHLKRLINNIFKFIIDHWQRIIHIIITSFLLLYFIITYNSFQMYEMKIEDGNNVTFDTGYYIKSKSKIVLNITNINILIKEDNVISETIKLYTFVNNEKTYFYEGSNIDYIMLKQFNGYEEYFNKKIINSIPKHLYIEIEVLKDDNTIKQYSSKLSLQKIVDSKWIIHREKMVEDEKVITSINKIDNNELSIILIKEGFEKIKDTKTYYKGMKNYTLYFDLTDEKMFYNRYVNNDNNSYFYYYNKDTVNYTKENEKSVLIKYQYQNGINNLKCMIGNCNDYKEVYNSTVNIFKSVINS